MPSVVKTECMSWCNRGNPSADYTSAKEARMMMDATRKSTLGMLKLDSTYNVIFTSGASEANATVVQGVHAAYMETFGQIPHFVLSAWEHKSILLHIESLVVRNLATATYIKPTAGAILPADIAAAIQPTTALVCVMAANNETGAIADIVAIGKLCHDRGVPYHCDAVQSVGKTNLDYTHCDSLALSYHKIHGPPGIGALVIKNKFLTGYALPPLIFGSQNNGLRGGTENLIGIGGAGACITYTMSHRKEKNESMRILRDYMKRALAKAIPTRNWFIPGPPTELEIVFFDTPHTLPNTQLLSVVWRPKSGKTLCNGKMKKQLEQQGVIVSVGSACNTASATASHVLLAMGVDEITRKGTLRITLGDETTQTEIKKFISVFLDVIKKAVS